MKTYEETRKAIGEAIKNYTDNTHAVARLITDVVTGDINCGQFDKFFEYLIERVLHYHNHRRYEEIIEKAGFKVSVCPLANTRECPNPDSEDKEKNYHKNLDVISKRVSDVADYKYDKGYTEKEHARLVSDLANAVYDGIAPITAIGLAKELLALNDDSIDSNDISEIIATMDYNNEYVTSMSVAIRDYISRTSQADMKDTLGYITHIISSCTNIENFSMFYALAQKELMERLNKEGENTDVF